MAKSAVSRSENMRRIRSRDTFPEMVVRRLVHGLGYRYRLHVADLPGKPDIVLPRLSKIIEVRGCFWHQHGNCSASHVPKSNVEYWRPKLKRNKQRDKTRIVEWASLGWDALIVWECECRELLTLKHKLATFLNA
jgi:DNA mismatch endonuclease (patch repair protein)